MPFGTLRFAAMVLFASVASAADLTWEQLIDRGAALDTTGNYAGAAEQYRAVKTLAGHSTDFRLVQTLTFLTASDALVSSARSLEVGG
jgi:hypothetical protein